MSLKRAKAYSVSANASQPDQTTLSDSHSSTSPSTAEETGTVLEQREGCEFNDSLSAELMELLQESDSSSGSLSKLLCLCPQYLTFMLSTVTM